MQYEQRALKLGLEPNIYIYIYMYVHATVTMALITVQKKLVHMRFLLQHEFSSWNF